MVPGLGLGSGLAARVRVRVRVRVKAQAQAQAQPRLLSPLVSSPCLAKPLMRILKGTAPVVPPAAQCALNTSTAAGTLPCLTRDESMRERVRSWLGLGLG